MQHDIGNARALQTLGLLTRGALHELSNPLLALNGTAELALADAEPGSKLHGRIALVQATGSEVAEIVKALQAFLRLQAEPEGELSLAQEARGAIALVERVLPLRGSTLEVRGDATVTAAPGPLRGALVELIVEALDGAEPGAPVELSIEEGSVRATGGGELRP